MKNYATETDIIETADPLFFPGDVVKSPYPYGLMSLHVRDFAWDAFHKTWTYCLVRFSWEGGDSGTVWVGSIAYGSVPEKDLKLISRQPRK